MCLDIALIIIEEVICSPSELLKASVPNLPICECMIQCKNYLYDLSVNKQLDCRSYEPIPRLSSTHI